MGELRSKTAKGIAWSAVDKFTSIGVNFVFNILIARVLLPSDYGIVAMIGIFTAVSACFIDSGFGSALIRKPDRTDDDVCTVFYYNIAVSVLFYLILFFSAPLIASFYNTPELVKVTRLVSLNLVISSFAGVHGTILSYKIDFKHKAIISISCAVLSGSVTLWMARHGFGAMALVAQGLTGATVYVILSWLIVKWRPRMVFSVKSFKEMFGYGSRLLASGLLNTVYDNLYTLVIGKVFSANSLGLYSKANSLAYFPSGSITQVFQSVTFPVLSSIQNDAERLRSSYRKLLNMAVYVVFPCMVGLAAVADPLVRVLLTDKWEDCIPYLRLICLSLMWFPVHAINLDVIQVKGRSDYFLRLEIIKKVLGVIVLVITVPFGVKAMCIGGIITSVLCLPINTFCTKKLIDFGFLAQMKDMAHILALTFVMGLAVFAVASAIPDKLVALLCGVAVGVAVYLLGSLLFRFPEFRDVIDTILKKQ